MNSLNVLPYEYERWLCQCKDTLLKKHNVYDSISGQLIRGKVLELLDKFCIVVYYPIPEDRNNGFHITDIPFLKSEPQHFVFINTAQTIEKQAFTAAHELGHIWKVDELVYELSSHTVKAESEQVISRFAAILLMPEKEFNSEAAKILNELNINGNHIDFMNFIKLVVKLMDIFFAPYKSIIIRMVELNMLTSESAEAVLCCDEETQKEIETIINQTISDFGYVDFEKPTNKKWIDGLSSLLDEAEQNGCVSQTKIDSIRKKFELKKHISFERKDVFTLNTNKES